MTTSRRILKRNRPLNQSTRAERGTPFIGNYCQLFGLSQRSSRYYYAKTRRSNSQPFGAA